VAYDLIGRTRTPFGTETAPDVALKDAVAASVAVPFVFEPVRIDDRSYVDGGITSGTHADLVLANPEPLDLLIVVAPLAADQPRDGARFYEDMFDRVGRTALEAELALIRDEWPRTDVLVFRPDVRVQEALTPNPLSIRAAIPAFLRTLRSFDAQLSQHETWLVLERHLGHHAARH
jgi:predicted acylesterase/phospholipase RssA